MRENLILSFTAEDIRKGIWSIDDNKVPDLDGYNSRSYKAAWSVVGPDVVTTIHSFFQTGKLSKAWSLTTITLVPKVPCPSGPGDYWPISCCHVIYKCIVKLLAEVGSWRHHQSNTRCLCRLEEHYT